MRRGGWMALALVLWLGCGRYGPPVRSPRAAAPAPAPTTVSVPAPAPTAAPVPDPVPAPTGGAGVPADDEKTEEVEP